MFTNFYRTCFPNPSENNPTDNLWKGRKNLEGIWTNLLCVTFKSGQMETVWSSTRLPLGVRGHTSYHTCTCIYKHTRTRNISKHKKTAAFLKLSPIPLGHAVNFVWSQTWSWTICPQLRCGRADSFGTTTLYSEEQQLSGNGLRMRLNAADPLWDTQMEWKRLGEDVKG